MSHTIVKITLCVVSKLWWPFIFSLCSDTEWQEHMWTRSCALSQDTWVRLGAGGSGCNVEPGGVLTGGGWGWGQGQRLLGQLCCSGSVFSPTTFFSDHFPPKPSKPAPVSWPSQLILLPASGRGPYWHWRYLNSCQIGHCSTFSCCPRDSLPWSPRLASMSSGFPAFIPGLLLILYIASITTWLTQSPVRPSSSAQVYGTFLPGCCKHLKFRVLKRIFLQNLILLLVFPASWTMPSSTSKQKNPAIIFRFVSHPPFHPWAVPTPSWSYCCYLTHPHGCDLIAQITSQLGYSDNLPPRALLQTTLRM